MPENKITNVSSDHIDPATLDTTAPAGATPASPMQVFTISNGYANADPFTIPAGNAPVNEHTALSIPAYYSGCRFICETIAGLPKHVYQNTPKGPIRMDTHPAEWTLNGEPNELQTPHAFFSTFLLHAVNWSNGYAAYKADPTDPQLFILPPDRMTAFRFKGKQFYAYDTEQPTDPNNQNSRYIIFSADEMIHLPALSFDGMSGLPMVKMMSGTLRTMKNAEAYVSHYYGQGGIIGGVVESDKPLTKEQVQEYGDVITNKFSGVDKAHKWLVLGNGAKAKTLSPEMDTAQIGENRTFGIVQISQMLRIPPHLLFELGRATWANIESMSIEVVKYTLNNWIIPLEQELTRKLLTLAERKAGMRIRFDVSALLRGDHASQIAIAVQKVQNGLETPDEIRGEWELPPYEDGSGSRPRVQGNTITLTLPQDAPQPITASPGATPPTSPPAKALPPASDPEDIQDSTDLSAEKPAEQFKVKEHLKLSHFADLIHDAADRVHKKTAKATETAMKKHEGNPQAFIAWANVFCADQTHYSAEAVKPIFCTYANLSGKNMDGMADKCGNEYGKQLAKHLYALARKENSTPPDLSAIIINTEEE